MPNGIAACAGRACSGGPHPQETHRLACACMPACARAPLHISDVFGESVAMYGGRRTLAIPSCTAHWRRGGRIARQEARSATSGSASVSDCASTESAGQLGAPRPLLLASEQGHFASPRPPPSDPKKDRYSFSTSLGVSWQVCTLHKFGAPHRRRSRRRALVEHSVLPRAPRLGILLRPTPLSKLQVMPRWARSWEEDPNIGFYGTLRRISATHHSSGA